MLQITINIIDYSNYITCTNVERLFTTTNAQLLYLSPTTLYFVLKINFFIQKKLEAGPISHQRAY